MAPASTTIDEDVDYYDFLSIEATATDAEIQRAYRRTNLKYHPDKFKPTPELSLEGAASKLELLQKILGVLKDPVKRATYDQKREAQRRVYLTNQNRDADRKRRVVELSERETEAAHTANGAKRPKTEDEQNTARFQRENREKAEQILKQKRQDQAQQRENAEAQRGQTMPSRLEEEHRSVKIMWVKAGKGLGNDEATLRHICEGYGRVENVRVMQDKKRRIDGQEGKAIFGFALVIFAEYSAAQDAVSKGSWEGVESVEWAFKKNDTV